MRKPNQRSPLCPLHGAALGLALIAGRPRSGDQGPGRRQAAAEPRPQDPHPGHGRGNREAGTRRAADRQRSRVLLVTLPLMGHGPNGNPAMGAAPTRWCSSSASWPHWGQAAKRERSLAMGPAYTPPFRLIQNLSGIPGQLTR